MTLELRLWITVPVMGMTLQFSQGRRWSLAGKIRDRTRGILTEESRREISHMG